MSWNFRPSVLEISNYHKLSVDAITNHYMQDNERAQKDGVQVPPHPQYQQDDDQQQHVAAGPQHQHLRTIQWNLQAWTSPLGERNSKVNWGIMDTIFATNADIMVLNEYHWRDNNYTQAMFEEKLHYKGYQHFCGSNITPTLIATKCRVLRFEEIILSMERSALCLKIDAGGHGHQSDIVWVVGTHLDAFNGRQRHREMQVLLEALGGKEGIVMDDINNGHQIPIILTGDFNQQRQEDYKPHEWNRIQKSMDCRKVCRDDGVATSLERQHFVCVFDQLVLQQREAERNGHYYGSGAGKSPTSFNWNKASLPPSTHWSGTTIDYSYSRNLPVHGVYVSPAGFSDHRMTVCDWKLPAAAAVAMTSTTVSARHATTTTTAQRTSFTMTSTSAATITAKAAWIVDDGEDTTSTCSASL